MCSPQLLLYQDRSGMPIDPAVFHRLLVRNLLKQRQEVEEDIDWRRANRWFSTRLNRQLWKTVKNGLPVELSESDSTLKGKLDWLEVSLDARRHKNMDRELLALAYNAGELIWHGEEEGLEQDVVDPGLGGPEDGASD